jgi:hypothetical protein
METTQNEWRAYGDINPLQHGGLWMKQVDEGGNIYSILKVINLENDPNGAGFIVADGIVDITDDWICMEDVFSYGGLDPKLATNEDIALTAFSYYGAENCDGTAERYKDESVVIHFITELGITL